VFGYEGQTNNLKVVGTGDGGLEEMIDRLSSSHIMYAFCKVIDTKTSLPKCLLINWVSMKKIYMEYNLVDKITYFAMKHKQNF